MHQLRTYIRGCINAFELQPGKFSNDDVKIRWAAQFLTGAMANSWDRKRTEISWPTWTWAEYVKTMRDEYMHPQVRTNNALKKYHAAKQLPGQSVGQFVTYLDRLAEDLPPKPDEVQRVDLHIRLREELKGEIFIYPTTHDSNPAHRPSLGARRQGNEEAKPCERR